MGLYKNMLGSGVSRASVRVRVEGTALLEHSLKTLPNNVIRKHSRRAMKAGVKPIVQDAKSRVPVRYGYLRAAIGEIVKEYPAAFVAVAGVQRGTRAALRKGLSKFRHAIGKTRGGGTRYAVPAFYAHLVEGGTKPHAVGRGSIRMRRSVRGGKPVETRPGPQHGRMHPGAAPHPFFEPAARAHEGEILPIVAAILSEGLASESGK